MKEQTLSQKPAPQHRKPKGKRDPHYELAQEIAKQLGEVDKKPRMQIMHILRLCGLEFVQELIKETLEVEANGGMVISSGERRRTVGGVFFHLARERMSHEHKMDVFYGWQKAAQRRQEHEAQFPVFDWEDRRNILEPITNSKGGVTAVKIQITGQPGQIERRQNLVVFSMDQKLSSPENLPKAVPRPPEVTTFMVYLASSQWERIAEMVSQPDDEMVLDGYCSYDPEIGMMAVYAHQATTKKLLKAEKNQKKAANSEAQAKKGKKPVKADGRTGGDHRRGHEEHVAPLQVDINLPAGLPAAVAQKLTELHTAAASFRQKISALENKPAGQQFGLEMTQKLLKNTEQQIEKLEKQYIPR